LDCLRNIEYAGGIEELAKSLTGFPSLGFDKLLGYLERYGETSLYHRSGYLLDLLREDLRVPEWFLEKVGERLGSRVYYLTKKKGKFIKKWMVIAPKNIEEMIRVA
jgi:predicted transcriptional regulator of viral defense system